MVLFAFRHISKLNLDCLLLLSRFGWREKVKFGLKRRPQIQNKPRRDRFRLLNIQHNWPMMSTLCMSNYNFISVAMKPEMIEGSKAKSTQ